MRQVSYDELHEAMRLGSILAVAKALKLPRRLPEYFRRRGWPLGDDVVFGYVVRAIACTKIGALGEPLVTPEVMRQADKWRELGHAAQATRVVSVLDLGRFLEL